MVQLGPSHLYSIVNADKEVQRAYNFEVNFPATFFSDGGGTGTSAGTMLRLAMDAASLPTIGVEEITLAYGNRNAYVAGRATFETTTFTLKDFVDNSSTTSIRAWRRKVYNAKTDQVHNAFEYKADANIVQLSPDGVISRVWILEGCWPQSVNFGTLDYNSSDVIKVEVTIRYDRAWRVPKNAVSGNIVVPAAASAV